DGHAATGGTAGADDRPGHRHPRCAWPLRAGDAAGVHASPVSAAASGRASPGCGRALRDVSATEQAGEEPTLGRLILVTCATVPRGDAPHDLIHVLAATGPGRLAAGLAGNCSAHHSSTPSGASANHQLPVRR